VPAVTDSQMMPDPGAPEHEPADAKREAQA